MKYLNIFLVFFCVFIVIVSGKPGWLFGNDDQPSHFFQGQGVTRVKTVNNNNINYSDNSKHYNFNIQETKIQAPPGGSRGEPSDPTGGDVEVFANF